MSKDTVHKSSTPHSYLTPHKFPSTTENELDILNSLSVQLYPTGRVWNRSEISDFKKFHEAINQSFVRVINDGNLLLDGIFPDNPNFSSSDAALWEYRLGLITNTDVDLETRKLAIKRKLGHPNNIEARQHPLFIESQLQAAGFNVWVHENTLPYRTPEEIISISLNALQHGGDAQHGIGAQHGGESFDVIANSVEEVEAFGVGANNLWATFFLGGQNLGDIANVPYSRLREFKELVIKLKPAQTVAFTFITYN